MWPHLFFVKLFLLTIIWCLVTHSFDYHNMKCTRALLIGAEGVSQFHRASKSKRRFFFFLWVWDNRVSLRFLFNLLSFLLPFFPFFDVSMSLFSLDAVWWCLLMKRMHSWERGTRYVWYHLVQMCVCVSCSTGVVRALKCNNIKRMTTAQEVAWEYRDYLVVWGQCVLDGYTWLKLLA